MQVLQSIQGQVSGFQNLIKLLNSFSELDSLIFYISFERSLALTVFEFVIIAFASTRVMFFIVLLLFLEKIYTFYIYIKFKFKIMIFLSLKIETREVFVESQLALLPNPQRTLEVKTFTLYTINICDLSLKQIQLKEEHFLMIRFDLILDLKNSF